MLALVVSVRSACVGHHAVTIGRWFALVSAPIKPSHQMQTPGDRRRLTSNGQGSSVPISSTDDRRWAILTTVEEIETTKNANDTKANAAFHLRVG